MHVDHTLNGNVPTCAAHTPFFTNTGPCAGRFDGRRPAVNSVRPLSGGEDSMIAFGEFKSTSDTKADFMIHRL